MRLVIERVQEETFSFTPGGAEAAIHIRSGRLREWLLANAMDKVINLTFPEQTLDEIVTMHGLEEPRLRSMTKREAREPVIVGICGDGTNILIDGGHRRWFWAKRGIHTIKGWALPEVVWEAFRFDPNDFLVISHHADGSMLPQRRTGR